MVSAFTQQQLLSQKIGKSSLPAIMDVIKQRQRPSNDRTFEVAISVWMMIYKAEAPAGVALLKQEADKATDPAIRLRLTWAAYKAATGWCSPSDREQCKAMAQMHFAN